MTFSPVIIVAIAVALLALVALVVLMRAGSSPHAGEPTSPTAPARTPRRRRGSAEPPRTTADPDTVLSHLNAPATAATLAVLVPNSLELPADWQAHVDSAAPVEQAPPPMLDSQTRSRLRLELSDFLDPVEPGDLAPAVPEDHRIAPPGVFDLAEEPSGPLGRFASRRRIERRAAELGLNNDPAAVPPAPKAWSVENGYERRERPLDWRALDLPEEIPDAFVGG